MKYALTTTAKTVVNPDSHDNMVQFSIGNIADSAEDVYIRPVNTQNIWLILHLAGTSIASLLVPRGTQLEAYTDAGTVDMAVLKTRCSSSETQK